MDGESIIPNAPWFSKTEYEKALRDVRKSVYTKEKVDALLSSDSPAFRTMTGQRLIGELRDAIFLREALAQDMLVPEHKVTSAEARRIEKRVNAAKADWPKAAIRFHRAAARLEIFINARSYRDAPFKYPPITIYERMRRAT